MYRVKPANSFCILALFLLAYIPYGHAADNNVPVCTPELVTRLMKKPDTKLADKFNKQHPEAALAVQSYVNNQLKKITKSWTKRAKPAKDDDILIFLSVLPSGDITDVSMPCTSGTSKHDDIALWAIQQNNPLAPWPAVYREVASDPDKLKLAIRFSARVMPNISETMNGWDTNTLSQFLNKDILPVQNLQKKMQLVPTKNGLRFEAQP